MEGRITAILRQKGDTTRASLYLDENFAFGINEQTIERFRLRKGDYLDRELHAQVAEFDYFIDAKRIALSYLDHRSRSEQEIRERLSREDIPAEVIQKVIEFLVELGLAHDASWSRAFINDSLIRKPVSARQLASGLAQKGIAKEIIEEAIAERNAVESDEDRALQAAEKRWPRIVRTESDPRKRLQKLHTFLAGRGFDWDMTKRIHRRVAPEDTATAEAAAMSDVSGAGGDGKKLKRLPLRLAQRGPALANEEVADSQETDFHEDDPNLDADDPMDNHPIS